MAVETETDRDWAIDVETETISKVSLISAAELIGLCAGPLCPPPLIPKTNKLATS